MVKAVAFGLIGATGIFCAGVLTGVRAHLLQRSSLGEQVVSQLNQLQAQLKQLQKPELSPADIVAANRDSTCFIISTYTLSRPLNEPTHYRLLATGFLASEHTIVSNRHVLEPWFGDAEAERAIHLGATPHRGKILAYFPNLAQPVELSHVTASSTADVAIAHVDLPVPIVPLRLASQPSVAGDGVLVLGYPLGITTMLAKSTAIPYRISALRQDERDVDRLAQFRLIRPTSTQGHLADASGTTLMYDASTAHGSSGAPVFNTRGEVIGINAALITGFNGTSLGISIEALKPLLQSEGN